MFPARLARGLAEEVEGVGVVRAEGAMARRERIVESVNCIFVLNELL